LKWANEQRKLNGLFTEAQELYDSGRKPAALQKFRQVRVTGGDYRGVNQLIAQLEKEVASESRRSTVRRWTFGTVATATAVLALLVTLVVWQIKSEFAEYSESQAPAPTPVSSLEPAPAPNDTGSRATPVSPQPVRPQPAPEPVEPPRTVVRSGVGFAPVGRFRMMREDNPQLGFNLMFNADFTFRVEPVAGLVDIPAGSGTFAYNPASGVVALSGRDTLGAGINFEIEVFESAGDHFHAIVGGARWDVVPQ
jgi:hypothetical protein